MDLTELRDVLQDNANRMNLAGRIPHQVKRRARRRLALAGITAFLTAAGLFAAGSLLVTFAGRAQPSPPPAKIPLAIDLADYYEDAHQGRQARTNEEVPREEVDRHVACMRKAGFDLPDPTRTETGWSVVVEDPEALGFDTPAWREAAFVTCRPTPPPGAGDLVFGTSVMSEAGVEEFRSCMAAEGFELPAPRLSDGMWRFETSDGGIDFGDDAWNRAVFVICLSPEP
jgi:hypothetical protein